MTKKSNANNRKNSTKKKNSSEMNGERLQPQNHSGSIEKIKTGPIDIPFFLIIIVLLVMGIIVMFSAGYAWAIAEGLEGTYFVKRQMGMALAGLFGMLVISFIDYHIYRRAWIVWGVYFASAIMLILCLVGPFKAPHNDSHRWIAFGSFSFQPSEIAKFAIVLLFAYFISINYSRLKQFKYGVIPFVITLGVIAGLIIVETHLSATLIICAIGLIMMIVGGTKGTHILILLICGLAAFMVILFVIIQSKGLIYIQDRVTSWLEPFNPNAVDETHQIRNSLIAIGSGGIFGLGIGNSRQKFLYLPESQNDFVFAVACEELGIIGAVVIITLFLLFIIRGFHIASKSPDKFGMMLAVGLVVQIGLQAFLNFAVVTNTIPTTGISLPFFSYGGTALIMQLFQMGIVLNISRQSIIKT